MLNVNRVTLLGHVGRDPELRSNAGGDRAARFSLATTERWKDRDGEPQERTEWHRIIVFGGNVEVVERLVRKGTAVLVEGRLTVREYTDREDMRKQATEIIVGGPQGMLNVLASGAGREAEDPAAPAAAMSSDSTRSDWA